VQTLPGNHPALGGAILVALNSVPLTDIDLKSLTLGLLRGAGFPRDVIDNAAEADNPYDARRHIGEAGLKAGKASKSLRSELQATLASIEAAVRLPRYYDRYIKLSDHFFGPLKPMRAAHSQHCVCGSQRSRPILVQNSRRKFCLSEI
jgi:hypothetical protein